MGSVGNQLQKNKFETTMLIHTEEGLTDKQFEKK